MAETPPNDTAPPQPTGSGLGARVGKDIGPRVLSGLVLAGIALAATLAGGPWFVALLTVVAAVVAWEWGLVVRGAKLDVATVAHVVAVLAAMAMVALGFVALALLALVIGTVLVALLTVGRQSPLSALGVAYAGLPAVALTWLRDDPNWGLLAVLFIVGVVVVTDTAAYFSGRLVGGPKLWPRVSPNKTWAGLIGAVTGSALAAAIFAVVLVPGSAGRLALLGGCLAVVAQAGDLAESALKRRFGAKDASQLIPGHGGFMDRVDGLVTAAIVAALIGAVLNVHAPAGALLRW